MKIFVRFLIVISALFLIGIFVVLFAIYNSNTQQQEVLNEKTFGMAFHAIDISADNAQIDFLPSDNDTTRITLTGSSDDFTLKTDILGKRLIVSVEDQSRFFSFNFRHSYSLQVYIPASGIDVLSADSKNGAIQANDIQATELSLEADNGRITVESIESNVIIVETNNGAIEITDIKADIRARSSNGRIVFSEVSGELRAQTNNGRIELAAETLDFPVNFETNNGRIEIHTETEPTNVRIQARVDNGSLAIYGNDSDQVRFGNGGALIKLVSKNGRIIVD